jgi:esterase/lipase
MVSQLRKKKETLIHRVIAKRYGCNLYLARLDYHGRSEVDELKFMTPEGLYNSAKQAIAIGKKIGEEVIVVSTSTGGTLAILYAAYHDDLKGIINYSPNIRIKQKGSFILDKPWGLQLARIIYNGKFKIDNCDDYDEKYWNCKTRVEALSELEALVENAMKVETFSRVKTPSMTAYYYKDNKDQDPTVSVDAIRWMNDNLGTESSHKRAIAFPEAGTHVIANEKTSEAWRDVYNESCNFMEQVLRIKPLDQ